MKHLLSLLAAVVIFSCQAEEPTSKALAQESIEKHLRTNMHDPSSYSFVEIGEVDNMTIGDMCKLRLAEIGALKSKKELAISLKQIDLGAQQKMLELGEMGAKFKINVTKADMYLDSVALHRLTQEEDSLQFVLNSPDAEEIEFYSVMMKYRGKNANNAPVLESREFLLNPAYSVRAAVQ